MFCNVRHNWTSLKRKISFPRCYLDSLFPCPIAYFHVRLTFLLNQDIQCGMPRAGRDMVLFWDNSGISHADECTRILLSQVAAAGLLVLHLWVPLLGWGRRRQCEDAVGTKVLPLVLEPAGLSLLWYELASLGSQVITVFEGVFLQVSYFFSSWSVTEPSALKLWMAGVAEAAGQLACDSLSAPESSQSIQWSWFVGSAECFSFPFSLF